MGDAARLRFSMDPPTEQRPPASPRFPVLWRRALVAVLFAAFAVVELWTPIAHGGWFLPADDGQGWPITRVTDLPATPHNGLTGDVYEGLGPFLHYDVAQVRAAHLPTWNPGNGNGGPYLANGQSAVLSPYTGLYYLFGMRLGLLAAALAKLWLLGFFTYLFLVRHRLHEIAAVVGGALFAYAGFHLVWLDYQVAVAVSATLPVALWCARVALDQRDDRSGRRRRRLALAGLAAALGVMGVAGHTEAFLFDTLLVASYLLVALVVEHRHWRTRLAWAGRVAGAGALGVALALAQLLPLWQYQRDSSRVALVHSSPSRVSPGFPVDTVPLAAFANLFGGPQFAYYDSALYGVHEKTNYAEVGGTAVGVVGVCLIPVGMVALGSGLVVRRRRRGDGNHAAGAGGGGPPPGAMLGWFALGAMVVDGLLLFSRAAGTAWWHVPGIGVAVLNRSQDIVLFGVVALGAVGLDWMLRAEPAERLGRLARGLGAYAVAAAALVAGALSLRSSLGVAGASTHGVVGGNIAGQLVLAVLFAAGLVFVLAHRAPWLQVVVGLGMAVVAFASNGLVMRSYNTTVAARHVYPVTPALAAVEARIGTGETLFAGGSFPWADVNLWYGLRDVGSFDPLDLAWHDALYRRVFATADHGGTEQMPRCRNGLALFGVQWVVGGDGRFLQTGQTPLVASAMNDGIPIYRAPGSSLLSVVGRSAEASGDAAAIDRVSSCGFDPDTTVVLDSSSYRPHDSAAVGPVRGSLIPGSAAATVVGHRADGGLTVRVDSPGAAWVVVRQTWAPGWSATVDGRSTTVRRADVTFDAVRVPPGRHLVVLAYHAPGLRSGVIVSLAALAGVLALAASGVPAGVRRTRRGAHVGRRSTSS